VSTLASSYYAPYQSFAAFDDDVSDMWNSGCYSYGCYAVSGTAPPWVQGVLAGVTHVSRIELTPNQDITGQTVHNLYGFNPTSSSWVLLQTFSGVTQDGQKLVWSGSADVSAIYVSTTQSPTWVAWRDIQLYR
jgi:hypothetical protein